MRVYREVSKATQYMLELHTSIGRQTAQAMVSLWSSWLDVRCGAVRIVIVGVTCHQVVIVIRACTTIVSGSLLLHHCLLSLCGHHCCCQLPLFRTESLSQKGRCQDVTFSAVHNETVTPISVRTQMCLFFSKRKYNFCILFKFLPLT